MVHGITGRTPLASLGAGAAGMAGASMTGTAGEGVRHRHVPRGGIGMHLYTVRDILAADPLGTPTALAGSGTGASG
jgi:hypothetical protein